MNVVSVVIVIFNDSIFGEYYPPDVTTESKICFQGEKTLRN